MHEDRRCGPGDARLLLFPEPGAGCPSPAGHTKAAAGLRRRAMTDEIDTISAARRLFLRGAALTAVAAPILTEAHFAMAAAADPAPTGMALHGQSRLAPPPGAVLINANENPLGPCKAACEAIARIAPLGGRYDILGETEALGAAVARLNGVPTSQVAIYAGSSEPLHYT